MRKKVLIIGIFLAVFGAAWGALYLMRGIEEPALEPAAAITEERQGRAAAPSDFGGAAGQRLGTFVCGGRLGCRVPGGR